MRWRQATQEKGREDSTADDEEERGLALHSEWVLKGLCVSGTIAIT